MIILEKIIFTIFPVSGIMSQINGNMATAQNQAIR